MGKLKENLPFSVLLLGGRLGNQIYHYVFYRWYEIMRSEQLVLDDSVVFEGDAESGYGLENAFDIPSLPRFSKILKKDEWEKMYDAYKSGGGNMGKASFPEQLGRVYNFALITQPQYEISYSGIRVEVPHNFGPDNVRATKGPIYYHAFLGNSAFFNEICPIIRSELKFKPDSSERNAAYKKMMLDTNSAAIHIRRGDFVDLNLALDTNVYKKAMEVMDSKSSNITYFIFSDDIKWAKENEENLGLRNRLHLFVEGNTGENSFRDMELMTYCKHHFTYHSTFSHWGYYLRKNDGILVNITDL